MTKFTQAITVIVLLALMAIVVNNKAEIKSLQIKLAEVGEVCQTASTVESPVIILAPEYIEEESK